MRVNIQKFLWAAVIAVALGRALALAAIDLLLRLLGRPRVKFPKVRRVHARTVGQDLVSARPMAGPKAGGLFHLEYAYANDSTDAVEVAALRKPEPPQGRLLP
jgi:hypothetical protein